MEEKFRLWLTNKGISYATKYHIISIVISFIYDENGLNAKHGDYSDRQLMDMVEKLFDTKESFIKSNTII